MVKFSEPTEKGRSLRTMKLFLRKRGIVKENRTSQELLLTETEQAKRRNANREKSTRFREKLRRNKENLQTPSTAGSENNSGSDDTASTHLFVVKLDFKRGKKTSRRKWISREVSRAHKRIKRLQETNLKLQRKTWSLQKKLQRESKKKKKPAATATEPEKSPKTPRSKCNNVPRQMRSNWC